MVKHVCWTMTSEIFLSLATSGAHNTWNVGGHVYLVTHGAMIGFVWSQALLHGFSLGQSSKDVPNDLQDDMQQSRNRLWVTLTLT